MPAREGPTDPKAIDLPSPPMPALEVRGDPATERMTAITFPRTVRDSHQALESRTRFAFAGSPHR